MIRALVVFAAIGVVLAIVSRIMAALVDAAGGDLG